MTFSQVIGYRLRAIRQGSSKFQRRQEDFLEWLNRFGLGWTRDILTSVEMGRRHIGLEEFAILCAALLEPPANWFDPNMPRDPIIHFDADVELTVHRGTSLGALMRVFGGDMEGQDRGIEPADTVDLDPATFTDQFSKRVEKFRAYWPDPPHGLRNGDELDVWTASYGEAEEKAARKFDVEPAHIALIAHALWGRSLTEERDARAEERADDDTTERGLQAIRGHVTRDLLQDIEAVIEEKGKP